jgi:hypothetical protein
MSDSDQASSPEEAPSGEGTPYHYIISRAQDARETRGGSTPPTLTTGQSSDNSITALILRIRQSSLTSHYCIKYLTTRRRDKR